MRSNPIMLQHQHQTQSLGNCCFGLRQFYFPAKLIFCRLLDVTGTDYHLTNDFFLPDSYVPASMVIIQLKLDYTVVDCLGRSLDNTTSSQVASMMSTEQSANTNTTTRKPVVSKLRGRSKWAGFNTTNKQCVITAVGKMWSSGHWSIMYSVNMTL